jgi:hypothetical protein
MRHTSFRVDSRMIPPIILAMIAGAGLIIFEGPTGRGVLLAVILAPFVYLGLEALVRTIVVDDSGMTVHKLFRSTRVEWPGIEAVEAARTGSKVFLILARDHGMPILITNTIRPFHELIHIVLDRVPPALVTDSTRDLLTNPPKAHGPLIQAWVVFLALAAILAGRLLGYGP